MISNGDTAASSGVENWDTSVNYHDEKAYNSSEKPIFLIRYEKYIWNICYIWGFINLIVAFIFIGFAFYIYSVYA